MYAGVISIILTVLFGSVSFVAVGIKPEPADATVEVLWFDDFESEAVKWLGVGSGSVSRSTVGAFNGDASLNVTALTWNNEEALRMIGSPEYPMPVATLDFWFSMPMTNFGYFVFGLEYCSANRDLWYRSGIQLVSGEYENEAGAWTAIEGFPAGWDINDGYDVWHHASLSVDLVNGNYVSLTVDDYDFDLKSLGYKCYDRGSSQVLWGVFYPYFYSGGGYGSCSILIDDVTLMLE